MNQTLLNISQNLIVLAITPSGLMLFFYAIKRKSARLRKLSLYLIILGSMGLVFNSSNSISNEMSIELIDQDVGQARLVENHRGTEMITFFLSASLIGVSILGILSKANHLGLSVFITLISLLVIFFSVQYEREGQMINQPHFMLTNPFRAD